MFPSEETQKRLRDQYVPEDQLDVISLLDHLPGFILLPDGLRTYFLTIEKKAGYTLSYVGETGEVWYALTDKSFSEAVGKLFAFLLENEGGKYWVIMPGNPKYKGKKG